MQKEMGRKALSDIVTTVLLILLAIVAIFLLWLFLRPSLEDSTAAADLAAQCIKVDVYPARCGLPTLKDFIPLGALPFCPDYSGVGSGPDSSVGGSDLGIILGQTCGPEQGTECTPEALAEFDLNQDGSINSDDLQYLICAWGNCAPPTSYPLQSCNNDTDNDGVAKTFDFNPTSKVSCTPPALGVDGDGDGIFEVYLPGSGISPYSIVPFDGDPCDDCASGTYNPEADGCDVGVIAQRSKGEADVQGISLIVTLEDKSVKVIEKNTTSVKEGGNVLILINPYTELNGKQPVSVTVAPLIGEELQACQPKSSAITCELP